MNQILSPSSVAKKACFRKSWIILFAFVSAAVSSVSSIQAATVNALTDPGFESVPTNAQIGVVTGWTAVSLGFNALNQTDGTQAHSGTNYFKVFQNFSGQVNYTYIYQDIPTSPGATFTADGWAKTTSGDKLAGANIAWIDLTFRDAGANTLSLYRSAIISTNALAAGTFPVDAYTHLLVTNQYNPTTFQISGTVTDLVAPAGTAFVRYEIFFQGDANNAGGTTSGGSLDFDDLALNTASTNIITAPTTQWNIVWSDEFNGTSINPHTWTFESGNNNGWGNSEREYYTSSTNNARVDGKGMLHIIAQRQSIGGFNFSSARMKTQGLYNTPTYGRLQWRAALPAGVGMWPALWMMGSNYSSVGWPTCGEIDVVENNGAQPNFVQGSLHSGASQSSEINTTKIFDFPSNDPNGNSTTNFHVYELDWSATNISWLVDGVIYQTQTSTSPFNAPFFFILNLAVGGNYVSNPSDATIETNAFPKEMVVDYVRVYEQTAPLQITPVHNSSGAVLTWPTNIVCHLQAQTNFSPSSTNWTDLAVSNSPYVLPNSPSNGSVFYRLVSP